MGYGNFFFLERMGDEIGFYVMQLFLFFDNVMQLFWIMIRRKTYIGLRRS
jgi:hypothetical protein